jgi:hypothetical protein
VELKTLELQFLERGFAVVPGAISADELAACADAFDSLIAKAEDLGGRGLVRVRRSDRVGIEGRGWSWGCDHVFQPLLCDQRLLNLVGRPPFPELLELILGPRFRFCGGHGHWSPTNYDYYLHWHRDTRRERWWFGNTDPRCHVQLCLALREEGVVRLVPGSHLRDLVDSEAPLVTSHPHGAHPQEVTPVIPAGSALLLNTYTLHRAQCSRSTPRRALHFGFTRVGAATEPGRSGHPQPWLGNPAFFLAQSPFLRLAIQAQLSFEEANRGACTGAHLGHL